MSVPSPWEHAARLLNPTRPPHLDHLEADWERWVRQVLGPAVTADFAAHHRLFWEWVWQIRPGIRPRPLVNIWSRGAAKSTSAEGGVVALGARRRRRYALYISSTQDSADQHVANIGAILESRQLEELYPDMAKRDVNKYGSSRGWRRNRLATASGFVVDALGLDTQVRGIKFESSRPDLMCHEVGTLIHDEGRWMPVESHPGLLGKRWERGHRITVWGVPTAEVVTDEHRYWARTLYRGKWAGEAGWMEAQQIAEKRALPSWGIAIGVPIDPTVIPIEPVPVGSSMLRQMAADGRVSRVRTEHREVVAELADPEWWWLVGLWWGDGHVSRGGGNQHAIGITVADTQPEIGDRVKALLRRWDYGWHERAGAGCSNISFSCKWMYEWLLTEWRKVGTYRAGQKCPPQWVEQIDLEYQAKLMRGYFDADGYLAHNEVRLTSVSLIGLMAARRILARLGIPASVRNGPKGEEGLVIMGRLTRSQRRYDLRICDGAKALGFDMERSARNSRPSRVWIEDGYLWSTVRAAERTEGMHVFAPIRTASATYQTWFGLSHNCIDDVDEQDDPPGKIGHKIDMLTHAVIPAGSTDLAVLAIQNLIHRQGIFGRLAGVADERADFLVDRVMSGPIPAVEGLEYKDELLEGGDVRHRITVGTPTWSGMPLEICQQIVDTEGITAFLAERQHLAEPPSGGLWAEDFHFARCDPDDVPDLVVVEVWVDPAVTDTDRSDRHAIQVDGLAGDGRIFRLHSWEARTSPEDSLRRAIRLALAYGAMSVGVETDQGGDTWQTVYRAALTQVELELQAEAVAEGVELDRIHWPSFKQAKAGSTGMAKAARAQLMLADYERPGRIVHVRGTHEVLERALRRFPRTKPFDLVDAAYWSFHHLNVRRGGAGRTSARQLARARLPV